jgi:hypothetical protein
VNSPDAATRVITPVLETANSLRITEFAVRAGSVAAPAVAAFGPYTTSTSQLSCTSIPDTWS